MNTKVCAPPNSICCWEEINFNKAEKYVKKLQKRIAVAYANDNHDVVMYLQHTLIHSFYAKALAIKYVSTNRGKNTPGVDGIVWNTSKLKFDAINDLRRRGYKHKPLRRIYILKSNGKRRPLSIPTMKDRAMQTLYKFALEPIGSLTADLNSFAFLPNRNARSAVVRLEDVISDNMNFCWILKADIKGCFDNISHEWIMKHIPMDKTILWEFLKCGYVEDYVYYPTEKGIPQGGCISSVICNMVLDGLEKLLEEYFGQNASLIRYADDIIVLGMSKEFLVQSVLPVIQIFLSERGLQLSKEKTTVTHIENAVTFLGFKIFKERERIMSIPARKSIDSLICKIVEILINEKYSSFEQLCISLKKVIRGWLNYYRNVAVEQCIYGVEFEVVSVTNELTGDTKIAEYIGRLFEQSPKQL